jgi:adenine specific DNA methylase Mod
MSKKQKFYSILKDLFVGAKLEGDSGFVNLMNIKTAYFEKIRDNIKKEIDKKFPDETPEDLYDKLYTFFDSYFSDGGSIFFSSTPVYKNIYTQVYSDRKDVSLFWKTAKLYYVKSEANYQTIKNLKVSGDDKVAFDFDASLLKHKQANEKKELDFYFLGINKRKGKDVLQFRVIYKNDNKYNKLEEILDIKSKPNVVKYLFENLNKRLNDRIEWKENDLDTQVIRDKSNRDTTKAEFVVTEKEDLQDGVSVEPAIVDIKEIEKYLKLKGIHQSQEAIEKAFKLYKKQTEIDYFIHKDARSFLREQFDLYMYQRLGNDLDTLFTQEDLDRERKLKEIAYLTIDYIANFEDELKAMWLKPKFARNSNYVLTLDKIAEKEKGNEIIQKIIKDKGIKEQIKEWEELGIIGDDFKKEEILKENRLNKDWQYLPIDTKYFKNLEAEILESFDDLDEELDGRLIKSENFQALNTLLPKYKYEIQTCYIDPPFNLGSNADFNYLVNYKDSTWVTLLENRIQLARDLINEQGSVFIRCDYNGNSYIRMLMDQIFGEDNFRNEIILSKSAKLTEQIKHYHSGHDSLYFYSKSGNFYFKTATKKRESPKWREMHLPGIRWSPISNEQAELFSKENIKEKNRKFVTKARIILGKEMLPPEGRHWALSQDSIFELEKQGKIEFNGKGKPVTQEADEQKLTDNWTDWVGYSSKWGFTTENHELVLKRSIETSSGRNSQIVLDFFLGSGTTTAVAQKLRRKWIGVDMGEHLDNVALPRMKKVLAYDKSGISNEVEEYQGGGFFKYYSLEQYEEVLKKSDYNPSEKELHNIDFSVFGLTQEEKKEKKKETDELFVLSEKQAKEGLEVDIEKGKAKFVFKKLYPDVDIAETISNLFGKKIKQIKQNKVIFEDEMEIDLDDLDFEKYPEFKQLIYW